MSTNHGLACPNDTMEPWSASMMIQVGLLTSDEQIQSERVQSFDSLTRQHIYQSAVAFIELYPLSTQTDKSHLNQGDSNATNVVTEAGSLSTFLQ